MRGKRMADWPTVRRRGGPRRKPRALHYAGGATWLVFCGMLACAFWPSEDDSPGGDGSQRGWSVVPGEPIVMDSALPPQAPDLVRLHEAVEKLRPLHELLGKTEPGDWLHSHPEPGQSFRRYLACRPRRASHGKRGARNRLYVQPLGEFTPTQRRIINLTAEYMGIYFGLPVEIRDDLPLSLVPEGARRVHPGWGDRQLLTTYILDRVLRPRLPDDAAAYIAFTASDLWPGEGWNFVFGQATLYQRVGVWSIYRFGDPEAGRKEFAVCLLRTMKLATHETGHMFSMLHCIAYQCNMCGSNNLPETDRHPPWLCSECVAKLCWATGAEPVDRYRRLEAFCRAQGFEETAEFCRSSREALSADAPSSE